MEHAQTGDDVRDFIEETLRTGLMLSELIANLAEDLPADAYPGEDNVAVVLEMVIGSVRPALEQAGADAVRDATRLLAASRDRAVEDLERALELARRWRFSGGRRRGDRGCG